MHLGDLNEFQSTTVFVGLKRKRLGIYSFAINKAQSARCTVEIKVGAPIHRDRQVGS